jgi:hypothetical protein
LKYGDLKDFNTACLFTIGRSETPKLPNGKKYDLIFISKQ